MKETKKETKKEVKKEIKEEPKLAAKPIDGIFESEKGYEAFIGGASISACTGDEMYCFTQVVEEYKRKKFF